MRRLSILLLAILSLSPPAHAEDYSDIVLIGGACAGFILLILNTGLLFLKRKFPRLLMSAIFASIWSVFAFVGFALPGSKSHVYWADVLPAYLILMTPGMILAGINILVFIRALKRRTPP